MQNKQNRFAEEYVIDFNATKAAERAGYNTKSAYSQGSRLLKNAEVKKNIEELLIEKRKNTTILQSRIITELEKIAFANMSDYVEFNDKKVKLKDSKTIDCSVVQEVSVKSNEKKLKLHDKIKALQELEKITGMVNVKEEKSEEENLKLIITSASDYFKNSGNNGGDS